MKRAFILLLAFAWMRCSAQGPSSTGNEWTGEWGQYQQLPSPGSKQYLGARMSVSDCAGDHCKLDMAVSGSMGSHCDTSADATLDVSSGSTATAHLGGDRCTLAIEKSGSASAAVLSARQSGGNCSDYCTPGADFNHSFPFRSKTQYFGDDLSACFIGRSRAQMALCGDPTLAKQEHDWAYLASSVGDLEGNRFDWAIGRPKMIGQCDDSAEPAACLKNAYEKATTNLNERKQEWLRQVTEPGDPEEAAEKIGIITGNYRHSFENGDVQGDTFKAVNKISISKAGEDSIRYSLYLEFYNGHECNKQGVASYRENGAFVDQVKENSGEMCVFEISPTKTGVQLLDPTGICKMNDCGERGGYNGAGFTFAEKVKIANPN